MVELFTIDHEPAVNAPDPMSATERLLYVTGPSDRPSESHHALIEAFAGELRRHRPGVKTRYSRWVAIYEGIDRAQAAREVGLTRVGHSVISTKRSFERRGDRP